MRGVEQYERYFAINTLEILHFAPHRSLVSGNLFGNHFARYILDDSRVFAILRTCGSSWRTRILATVVGRDNYNEDGEARVPAVLISHGPPPGTALAGTCRFSACPTKRQDNRVLFTLIEKIKRALRCTVIFQTTWFQTCRFFEKLGS